MKLAKYLETKNLTQTAFAAKVGVTQVAMNRYVRGERTPSVEIIAAIHKATKGAVTLNDWVKVDEAEKVA